MASVMKSAKPSFKTVIYAIMNSITTNNTSHKSQCDASIVTFAVSDAQCQV